MPTGYTCYIEDGKIDNAKDFLMLCARQFGACISMRDEPLLKPIPEKFEAETFYQERVKKLEEELQKLREMTAEQAEKEIEERYQKRIEERESYKKRKAELFLKYQQVLSGVYEWKPPTAEHEGLKRFAIEQIEMCIPDLTEPGPIGPKETPQEYIENRLKWTLKDIADCRKAAEEEKRRNEERNKWIADLRASLE